MYPPLNQDEGDPQAQVSSPRDSPALPMPGDVGAHSQPLSQHTGRPPPPYPSSSRPFATGKNEAGNYLGGLYNQINVSGERGEGKRKKAPFSRAEP